MRKISVLLLLFLLILGYSTTNVYGESYEIQGETGQQGAVEPFARSGYRSPPRTYNPGVGSPSRTAPTPARPENAVRNPAAPRVTPTPAPRTGFGRFWGGLFGGLALGTILGSLFNPFAGFSLGFPGLSLLSLALWVFIIFAVVWAIRRSRRKEY